MARIHGKDGQVLMDPAGGSSVVEVEDLSKWDLNLTRDRQDVTCMGDSNKQRVSGLPDFSGTLAGFWNSSSVVTLFDAILGTTAVYLHLVPNRNEVTYYFKGLANLDGSVSVDVNGAVSFQGTWDAAGNWEFDHP